MKLYAEIKIDGQWQRVGPEFTSTYPELQGHNVDRVFDGYDKELFALIATNAHHDVPEDMRALQLDEWPTSY